MPTPVAAAPNTTNRELLDLSIVRTSSGMKIKAQSADLESFFKANSNGETNEVVLLRNGERCKVYKAERIEVPGCTFDGSGTSMFIDANHRVNLSFLRMVGLTDGIEFNVPAVHSRSQLARAAEAINESIKTLYAEYIEPIQVVVKIAERT